MSVQKHPGTCSSRCIYCGVKSLTLDSGISNSTGVQTELHGETCGGGEDAADLGSQQGLSVVGDDSRQQTSHSILSHFLNLGCGGQLTGDAKYNLTAWFETVSYYHTHRYFTWTACLHLKCL